MANHVGEQAPGYLKLLDALDRAWRTFYAAVGVDLLIALGTGLQQLMTDHEVFSNEFWVLLALLVSKSVLAAIAAFLLRYAKKPKVPTVTELPAELK